MLLPIEICFRSSLLHICFRFSLNGTGNSDIKRLYGYYCISFRCWGEGSVTLYKHFNGSKWKYDPYRMAFYPYGSMFDLCSCFLAFIFASNCISTLIFQRYLYTFVQNSTLSHLRAFASGGMGASPLLPEKPLSVNPASCQ